MFASTRIANTKNFTFIAVLVFKLLSHKNLLKSHFLSHSGVFIVNFEHIFSGVSIVDFE